jgi:type I restriction-modification system DNA methylase subunit
MQNGEKGRPVVALKKSDLYASLWASCDQLRGGMDASQYKDYILTLLFVKYVSDKAKADSNSLIDVPEGGSFDDMLAAKGKARQTSVSVSTKSSAHWRRLTG